MWIRAEILLNLRNWRIEELRNWRKWRKWGKPEFRIFSVPKRSVSQTASEAFQNVAVTVLEHWISEILIFLIFLKLVVHLTRESPKHGRNFLNSSIPQMRKIFCKIPSRLTWTLMKPLLKGHISQSPNHIASTSLGKTLEVVFVAVTLSFSTKLCFWAFWDLKFPKKKISNLIFRKYIFFTFKIFHFPFFEFLLKKIDFLWK